ncbi:phosphodiesterase [Rhizobium ruizarguesonis]|uniref:metallophosphoesterase n=1 Tax=Rhizobium ruizarguesonis TaxID=2081791 RepID=UPI00102F3E59|nr:metallophosphoesterase [Rhizobium ruizarguesonis]MBY5853548.1 phosphodiesterase [Rhizobium leguminosarum]MBC2807780.1 metallophosphoesterase [Rhizobium ruizarguesonis]NEJ92243.1 phosphodiesterase [Rhizobium ruizarguesonis]TAU17899.1 phosphodiesterase [Rhizobium ruizarguesonis]TAU59765.1 phosphodiesterase [Rhizobium ruizarguesonis]
MQRETTFIHLTDLHVGTPDDDHLFSDTTETLREVLDLVATVTPKAEFIIASGDLTNRGDAESFRMLKRIIDEKVDVPVIYALGNHDTRPGFYEGMEVETTDPDAPYDHDRIVGGIHIVTLDSSTPGLIGGTIDPEQFEWLAQTLDSHPDLPKLIVVHHPPALGETPDVAHWRTIHFPQSQRFAEMLRGRNIIGILSGHIHHDRVSVWHGIPVIVGTGQHAATDILRTDILRMVRGASFGIGTLRSSGLTMAFVPLPSDRAELNTYPLEMLLERAVPAAAE